MLLKTFLAMNGITKPPGDEPIPMKAKEPPAKEAAGKEPHVMDDESEEQELLDKLDFAITNPISMDEKEFVSKPFQIYCSAKLSLIHSCSLPTPRNTNSNTGLKCGLHYPSNLQASLSINT